MSSSALIMDASSESERQRGASSGIYMVGSDIGKIVGPLLGGLRAQQLGHGPTILIVGVVALVVCFVLSGWLRITGRIAA